MAELESEIRRLTARVQNSRIKMMREQPFYASLLMHMRFAVDMNTETMYTDSKVIAFSPSFVGALSEAELDFVLMHEVLHVVLGHCTMKQDKYDPYIFNIACDIVVNSNILYSMGINDRGFVVDGEECMYLTPTGEDGYRYTAPEVYEMLIKSGKFKNAPGSGGSGGSSGEDGSKGSDGSQNDARGRGKSKGGAGREGGRGKRGGGRSQSGSYGAGFDDHGKWSADGDREAEAQWFDRMMRATETANRCNEMYGGISCGRVPAAADRLLKELTSSRLDWRTLLASFIQEEVNDYTFSPPDRRFSDFDFFLPDYNDTDASVRNIVFLIDTSASMSDDMVRDAYSEIKGAVDQFGGRFAGYIACGDTKIYSLIPFDETTDIAKLVPKGGGGTDFEAPIRFVLSELRENKPACMIYITDGQCNYPDESVAEGVPFLWLLTRESEAPPWGRAVYMGE